MERIREAVQRAKQERGVGGAGFGGPARSRSVPDELTQDAHGPLAYTRTRTVEVSRAAMKEKRIVSGFETGAFTDAFKILSTQVSQKLREHHWTTLGITSPGDGEGKTLIAINLAISLAMEYHQTALLVDADLRQPSIHHYFGWEARTGLSDYLVSDTPVEELLINPGIEGFVVLPGGQPQLKSSEMLGWRKMTRLVEELKDRYASRLIVFDLPTLLTAADVLAFAPHIDAVLLVVEEGKTRREDIGRAAELLSGTHLIGTVLNKSHEPKEFVESESPRSRRII
jgi:protein-tyrosine kinase